MLQTDPIRSRRRRALLSGLGVVAIAGGVLTGAEVASAATPSSLSDLQTEFGDSTTTAISLGNAPLSGHVVLQTQASKTVVLDLHGQDLSVDGIWLTYVDPDPTVSPTFSSLDIIDTVGGGLLTVDGTSSGNAAIEVDSGSSLTITDAAVTATAAGGTNGAGIGGGSIATTQARTSGSISIDGASVVTATGSARGAGIGGGYLGANGSITIGSYATVNSTSTGSGAAIGGGASPLAGAVGSVTISDHAQVTANASGSGSAIGGGFAGGGGGISVSDNASVLADASNGAVAIGDGAGSNQGTSFTTSLAASVVAKGGSGAGVGSGAGAAGNDVVTTSDRSSLIASSIGGAGIGGAGNSGSAIVNINDSSSVVASGGGNGAGIGAGDANSYGAAVSVAPSASLTVRAASGVSAIGGSTYARYGTFSSSGALTLPAGQTIVIPLGAQFSTSGTFTNNGTVSVKGQFLVGGAMTNNGTVSGTGSVTNTGAINQLGAFTTAVDGSYYHILFDSQGGSVSPIEEYVWADSVNAAGLALPVATPPSVGTFSGWNASPDGTGGMLTNYASISGLTSPSTVNQPGTLRVYALYQLAPVLRVDTALPQGVVGSAYSASVAATAGTAPIHYTYKADLPAGLSLDYDSGLITGTPTTSGTFTMKLAAGNAAGTSYHDYTIQIVSTVLHVTAPTTPKKGVRYLAGGRFDVTLSGLQANESYKVTVGGKSVATGRAPTNQAFSVRTTIPKTIGDGTQTVKLTGTDHALGASSTILTASVAKSLGLKLSAKKVKHGKKIVITTSKLYAGESARVVIKGKHGKVSVGTASAKGVYTLTLKKGLAKGKYTVTVTGAGTSRKASAKLTVS